MKENRKTSISKYKSRVIDKKTRKFSKCMS